MSNGSDEWFKEQLRTGLRDEWDEQADAILASVKREACFERSTKGSLVSLLGTVTAIAASLDSASPYERVRHYLITILVTALRWIVYEDLRRKMVGG